MRCFVVIDSEYDRTKPKAGQLYHSPNVTIDLLGGLDLLSFSYPSPDWENSMCNVMYSVCTKMTVHLQFHCCGA